MLRTTILLRRTWDAWLAWALWLGVASASMAAALPGVEPLQRLDLAKPGATQSGPSLALTLDACGGGYDARLIATLVRLQVPATIFVTQRWLARNPDGLRDLLAHPQLFELQNHGARHVPAVLGQRLYGMPGASSLADIENEIQGGAHAIQQAVGKSPTWYRGAGARYDEDSLALIRRLGYQVAGYSLNADDGARAAAGTVARRVAAAQAGEIILAHMNHPASGTAQGLEVALPRLLRQGLQFVRLSQVAGVVALAPAHQATAPPRPRKPAP